MRNDTKHLLKSPRNAARLRESIAQLEAGKGTERKLIDIDAGYERAMRRFPRIIAGLAEGARD